MNSQQPAGGGMGFRWLLRITGLVLWILVFTGAYVVWQARKAAESLPVVTAGGPLPVEPEPKGDHPAHVLEKPERIRLPWDPEGIEDFELTERSGRTVTKADLLGKPWAVGFIFTRCAGPCMDVTGQMYRIQEALQDRDVRLVTISVDPDRDTLDDLTRYGEAFSADPDRWLFLTGPKDEVYGLIRNSFLMTVEEDEKQIPGWEIIHTTNVLHVDAQGRVQGKYDAQAREEIDALIEALRADSAPREAAETGGEDSERDPVPQEGAEAGDGGETDGEGA